MPKKKKKRPSVHETLLKYRRRMSEQLEKPILRPGQEGTFEHPILRPGQEGKPVQPILRLKED